MKIKVHVWDKQVYQAFGKWTTWTLAIFSVAVLFLPIEKIKWWLLVGLLGTHGIIYILCWVYCNNIKKVKLTIGGNFVIVKEGDLFAESGKKVIPFNERFDTDVDDIIVAKKSLNGLFVTEHCKNVKDLDKGIKNYLSQNRKTSVVTVDQSVPSRKKIIYKLGTIVPYDDYYLLAYSHFDDLNRAYLNKSDVIDLYMRMWEEIDIVKAHNSVAMPVLGSSRLVRGFDLPPQQLIELILWSLRISKVKFTRSSNLTIVIHSSMIDDINLLNLKCYSDHK